MVQSLNSVAECTAKGISFLGIGAKYGKILVGDRAFEFFNDNNVADYIQIPWENTRFVYVGTSHDKVSRRFKIETDKGTFDFSSPESGKILKVMRIHLGNEKILKNPTLYQRVVSKFKKDK